MTEIRTLPIHVAPHPGEALDSWLEALAHRFNTHLADLLIALGLADRDDDQIHASARWTIRLHHDERSRLAQATATTPETIDAMTLTRYDGTALRIDPATGSVTRQQLWGRARGSRFCPDCVAENGGRWLLSWRLGWSFACLRHRRLLADACPGCGRVPRYRPHPVHVVPQPGYCTGPQPGRSGLATQRCGAELSRASTPALPADHPALAAQRQLLDVIESGTAAFGVYRHQPQPASAALSDIRALANRTLTYATARELASILPADILAADTEPACLPTTTGPTDPQGRPGFMAPSSAVTTAVAVTAAFSVLGEDDAPRAGAALRWLIDGGRRRGAAVNASTIHTWGSGTTSVLAAVQLAALDPFLKPSDRLRYRSSTPTPRPPGDTRTAARRAHRTPTLLWPEWFTRLTLPWGHTRHHRPALSCALQLVGTGLRLSETARLLDSPVSGHGLSRILQLLAADPRWRGIYTALVRLAEYLDTHEATIDYARRRNLDYAPLLADEHWSQLCRKTGILPGVRKAAVARAVLFERISGLPASQAPFAIDDGDFRARVAAFPIDLTPELADELNTAASRFLHGHGIDEPVTWHPPLSLLDGLDLPGVDPSLIDVALLHRLIRDKNQGLRESAERLDTTIDVVRLVLETEPAPRAQVAVRALDTARTAISKDDLADLYHRQQLSLHEIASRVGVSRQTITRLAREYDVDIRTATPPRIVVDRDWLYEQYVVHRRSLPDLAHECGMSTANMARWAKTHEIPLRGRGGASHHAMLRAADRSRAAPKVLRPALTSAGGWDRLRRFVAAARFPTIGAAASALGNHQSTLTNQIHRLERDLGGQLLVRAERGRPMALTVLGTKVARAVQQASEAPTVTTGTGEGAP